MFRQYTKQLEKFSHIEGLEDITSNSGPIREWVEMTFQKNDKDRNGYLSWNEYHNGESPFDVKNTDSDHEDYDDYDDYDDYEDYDYLKEL